MSTYSKNQGYYLSGTGMENQKPDQLLRKHAEEWLGPERSLEDLEVWEQRALFAEIEEELFGDALRPRLQTVVESEYFN